MVKPPVPYSASVDNFWKSQTMKIFSWVHKTLHHSSLKDGFYSNMRKAEPDVIKLDTNQVSLKEVSAADVLGGWKDGILTIGTLGYYDPFKSFNQHKGYLALENDEDDQGEYYDTDGDEKEDSYCDSEHEEMKPLIHTTFKDNFEHVVYEKSDHHANAAEAEVLVTLNTTPTLVSDEVIESMEMETDQKKKGERITLADLFLADTEKVIIKHDTAKVLLHQPTDKPSLKAKHGLPAFTEKIIPRVKSNPIRNIPKLMKKMIRKKIHPELHVKNQKPCASEISENHKIEGTSG